jgi:hypothetical protein
MSNRNPKNERIKRQYGEFLKHADGKAEATIRQVEKAIQRYESFTSLADFANFDQRRDGLWQNGANWRCENEVASNFGDWFALD